MPAAGVISALGQRLGDAQEQHGPQPLDRENGTAGGGFGPSGQFREPASAAGPHGRRRRGCTGEHDPLASVVAQLFSSCPHLLSGSTV
jgi:hypothetical protein